MHIRTAILAPKAAYLPDLIASLSERLEFDRPRPIDTIRVLAASGPGEPFDFLLVDAGWFCSEARALLPKTRPVPKGTRIVALAAKLNEAQAVEAIGLGADGYCAIDEGYDLLCRLLVTTWEGGVGFSPLVLRCLFQAAGRRYCDPGVRLSAREKQIIMLLAGGCTYKEVAELTKLSAHTVYCHTKRIYSRMQVRSISAAISRLFVT